MSLGDLQSQAPAPDPRSASDESRLIDELRRKSQSAYRQLVAEYGPRMRAVIRRYLKDDADADDALQDAFISAARAIDRFNQRSSLSTWLHTVAARAALMKLRSRASRPDQTRIDDLLPTYNWIGHRVMPVAPAESAEVRLQTAQMQELVRNLIDRLPADYRTVLMARDIEQLSTEETAEALGLTQASVKTRLHRARAALRTLLEPYIRNNSI